MKDSVRSTLESEPVGIIISRGARTDPAPVFLAFVWAAAPEAAPVPRDTIAA